MTIINTVQVHVTKIETYTRTHARTHFTVSPNANFYLAIVLHD